MSAASQAKRISRSWRVLRRAAIREAATALIRDSKADEREVRLAMAELAAETDDVIGHSDLAARLPMLAMLAAFRAAEARALVDPKALADERAAATHAALHEAFAICGDEIQYARDLHQELTTLLRAHAAGA